MYALTGEALLDLAAESRRYAESQISRADFESDDAYSGARDFIAGRAFAVSLLAAIAAMGQTSFAIQLSEALGFDLTAALLDVPLIAGTEPDQAPDQKSSNKTVLH